jgi:hypothetical protein
VALVLWSRAHGKMAAGITDPAKFNLFGAATDAVSRTLP